MKTTITNDETGEGIGVNITQDQFDTLKELLSQWAEPEEEWMPKEGENYWWVGDLGELDYDNWRDDEYDNYRYNTNNCFPTKEQAQKQLEKNQALARINQTIREKGYRASREQVLSENKTKYCVKLDFFDGSLDSYSYSFITGNSLVGNIKDKQSAQALIKEHEEDLKLLLDPRN